MWVAQAIHLHFYAELVSPRTPKTNPNKNTAAKSIAGFRGGILV